MDLLTPVSNTPLSVEPQLPVAARRASGGGLEGRKAATSHKKDNDTIGRVKGLTHKGEARPREHLSKTLKCVADMYRLVNSKPKNLQVSHISLTPSTHEALESLSPAAAECAPKPDARVTGGVSAGDHAEPERGVEGPRKK